MFKLNINNYRSFNNETIDLSRINILIGENSGGKSSLLKFLLALKQTLETPYVSNLILSGTQTDLGTYREVVNNHNEDKRIDFSFSFKEELPDFWQYFMLKDMDDKNPKKTKYHSYVKKALKYETTVAYSLDKNLDIHSSIQTSFYNEYLGSLNIIFSKQDEIERDQYDIVGESPKCILIYKSKTRKKEYIIDEVEYDKKGFLTIIHGTSLRKICKEKFNSSKMFFELSVFLLNQNLIEFYVENIRYLNPLSSKPERIYFNKDSQNQYKKSDLEKFTNLITNNQVPKKNMTKFGNVLREFGIADGIQIISPKNLPVSELRVKIKELLSNVSDVGYGVALQIPLLFEAFMAEQMFGGTFLIEQPEVHLHPKLQSKFIETLLSLGEQNNYIIETHSEYIIRMLQVIVKNKAFNVSNEDVRIYYFSRGAEKFELSNHKLDEKGKMGNEFPEGFFDSSYTLTKALMF